MIGTYGCRSGFEEEGGLGEPCLGGGEVGHCDFFVWCVIYSLRCEAYEVWYYAILMGA